MRRLLSLGSVVGIALLTLTACTPNVNVTNTPSGTTGIQVVGQGEVTGTPDTLTIDLGISVLRPGVSEAADEAASLATDLINAIEAQGVDTKDVQTRNYSIYPEYTYSNSTQTLAGYRVTNTVTAKIHDIEAAGRIIDAATAAGGDAVQVSSVSFSLEDDEALLSDARTRAWNDAYTKAEQLASLSGVSLGSAQSIVESVSSENPVTYYAAEGARDAVSTPIEAGSQKVTVILTVQFSING
jgi:uncharacterized protein